MTSLLGLDDLDLTRLSDDAEVRITHSSSRQNHVPVAVVGMSGRAGDAADLDEFWAMILRGEEGYRELSEERRADVDAYLAARGASLPIADERYIGGTRAPSVADFDHRFFALSPQEAKTIDPHQRIFLEMSWAALEDAGYLSKEIHGDKVGVYVGMSSDFGEDYRAMIQAVTPDAPEISVAGNVKSMIGSRIAYLLDLKGPSMLIDTACSSGLVAAYTAYRAIQSGECTMALAGAVKYDLLPIVADGSGIGIKDIQDTESLDHHTRTFDRKCDGTSAAEGCFVFVLKALDRAQRDGDTIHAVIMGGAINQDGASNGITAPNADAQADLIESALADAGVGAEQISFIEAHGTATKLGDPIEISGIERAFSRHTSRKQFCGIGSVKTYIGHMDNASGLAGLAKLVMSLKHRTLPASLNFEEPNPNIAFPQTPVFVNDRTVPWSEDDQETLYAGINSFGLSGTNCHLIVRSADPVPARAAHDAASARCFVLPLSARDPQGLARLVERYREFLAGDTDIDPADLEFTASAGRIHHRVRAAFVFANRAELVALLDGFGTDAEATNDDVCRGEFRLVLERSEKRDARDLTEADRDQLNQDGVALLAGPADRDARRRLAALYVRGAEVDWRRAAPEGGRRISLPTYPFASSRCWVESDGAGRRGGLLDGAEILRTLNRDICVGRFDPANFWELAEHRIHGVSVLPGTGLVEMIVEAAQRLDIAGPGMVLRNVVFEAPLAVADGEHVEVHVIVEARGDVSGVTIAGRLLDGTWVQNATAELVHGPVPEAAAALDVDAVRERLDRELHDAEGVDRSKGLEISDRWTGSFLNGYADQDSTEILYEFELPPHYKSEIGDYVLHPALLDALINAPSNLYDDERLYLPFSYGLLTIHGPLPAHVFAHFRKRPESIDGQLYSFDLTVVDPTGAVVLTVENYCLKSAVDLDVTGDGEYGYVQAYRRTSPPSAGPAGGGTVLLCGDFGVALAGLAREVEAGGYDWVHVPTAADGAADERLSANREFAFGLLASVPGAAGSLAERVTQPVDEALSLLTLLSEKRPVFARGLLVLTRDALAVTGTESTVDPGQAGVLGLMRVAALEYKALKLRCVDTDGHTGPDLLVAEASAADRSPFLLYRDGRPYEPYVKKHAVPLHRATGATVPGCDGVVIISGGTGELGTAVARRLAERGARKIVLLGSDGTDATRAAWSDLERDLAVFEVRRLDLGDGPAVVRTVADLRERHGAVAGVLHLAGRPGVGFLYTKDVDDFRTVYRPKALGVVHLHEATLTDDLDFFVAFSSISGLVLNQGQSDYTAANLVLDSLAQWRRLEGRPALSLQWPAWREIGIAHRMDAVDEEELFPPLGAGEALDLVEAVVAWDDPPPVLMPGRMRRQTREAPAAGDRRPGSKSTRAVALYGVDGVDEVEQTVAQIWAATLDITEVDLHDEFSDLGGNSLLTSQMLKLYDERYPDLMDVTDLFRYTTIADQVACIKSRIHADTADAAETAPAERTDSEDIDRLLDMLEQGAITVEESQGLF